jgi:hypothetical protein
MTTLDFKKLGVANPFKKNMLILSMANGKNQLAENILQT